MRDIFSAMVLRKHSISYYQCADCGLLQTEEPYWLEEAYSEAISDADTGLVMRNVSLASKLTNLIYLQLDPRASYLDIAGGYGMLTRLMRDHGFDYYWDDTYCRNLMARGFEAGNASNRFNGLSAFEVLEHIHDPLTFIKSNFGKYGCQTLIFTTELYEGEFAPPADWWYYAFNSGQHITFYQRKTFETIAKALGVSFYSVNGLHILTDQPVRITTWLTLITGRLAPIYATYVRRILGSLTLDDHFRLIGEPPKQRSH